MKNHGHCRGISAVGLLIIILSEVSAGRTDLSSQTRVEKDSSSNSGEIGVGLVVGGGLGILGFKGFYRVAPKLSLCAGLGYWSFGVGYSSLFPISSPDDASFTR